MKVVLVGEHIALQGVLNFSSAAEVRATLHQIIEHTHGGLVIDAAELIIADATGLGVLLGVYRRLQSRSRELCLLNPSMGVRHHLARTGMHEDIRVTHDLRGLERAQDVGDGAAAARESDVERRLAS